MKAFYEDRSHRDSGGLYTTLVDDLNFFAHWHREIELVYVLEGRIGAGANRDYRVLESGNISICESNSIHYYNSQGYSSKTAMIIFEPELLAAGGLNAEKINIKSAFIQSLNDVRKREHIESIIKEIIEENSGKKTFNSAIAKLKLSELFFNLFRYDDKYYNDCVSTGSAACDRPLMPVQKALKFIEDNYSEEITLESLSGEAGLSPFYFSRLFKTTTGTNYNIYLSRLRIERAEHLLMTTDEHVIDIAYKTGFKSIRTFNRTFRAIKGCTPQDVRKI